MKIEVSHLNFDITPKSGSHSSGVFTVCFPEMKFKLPLFRFKVSKENNLRILLPKVVNYYKNKEGEKKSTVLHSVIFEEREQFIDEIKVAFLKEAPHNLLYNPESEDDPRE